jgi:hypothetical protein
MSKLNSDITAEKNQGGLNPFITKKDLLNLRRETLSIVAKLNQILGINSCHFCGAKSDSRKPKK